MSNYSLSKLFVLALMSAMYGCTSPLMKGLDLGDPAPISKAPPSATTTPSDGIKVVAIPLKQTVELGEPIYFAVHVTNMRQEPIDISGSLRPGEGLIEIYSINDKGEKVLLPPLSDNDFDGTITLAPEQTVGDVFPIFFGANGWNFTKAGDYRIFAQLKIPSKEGFSSFNSEPAQIEIEPSTAGQALFSADARNSREAGKFLLWRSGDHLENGINHLTNLAEKHPDSSLSSYIFAAQVRNYSEPFANYTAQKVRVPNCQKANLLRNKVNTKVLAENILIEDYMSKAKCHAETKSWKEAQTALEAGLKLSGDRPEFKAYYRSLENMQSLLQKQVN